MGSKSKSTVKKAVGNVATGGSVQLGIGSEAVTKKLGEETGAYTPTSAKKQAETDKINAEKAEEQRLLTEAEQEQEDIRRRTAIFQSTGGNVSVGGRNTVYGN